MQTFSREDFELLGMFEAKTGAKANDVIVQPDSLIFLVREGDVGKAIGKGGANLERLRQSFKRNVEIVEDASDVESFVRKVLKGAGIRTVSVADSSLGKVASIAVDPATRGIAIGKAGANIKKLKLLLKRKFSFEDAKIL